MPASRTRRAINWVTWLPKSRTKTLMGKNSWRCLLGSIAGLGLAGVAAAVQRRDRLAGVHIRGVDIQRPLIGIAGEVRLAGAGIDIAQRVVGGRPRRVGDD